MKKILSLFLKYGYKLKNNSNVYLDFFHKAESGSIDDLNFYLKFLYPNSRDTFGKTALFYAIENSNIENVKFLLSRGSSVNIQDMNGYTPLILASFFGEKALVSLLLKNKANPNIKNNLGETALMWSKF